MRSNRQSAHSAEEQFMTVQEVAEVLAVSVQTVWKLVKQEGFPQPVRYNRKLVRWKKSEVMKYLSGVQTG